MIKSVFRKIANNFWLFFCLILGSLLITAILAAIPIYTDGALRKMLRIELDEFSNSEDGYVSPGEMYTELYFRGEYAPSGVLSVIEETDRVIEREFRENNIELNDSFQRATISNLISADASINQNYAYSLQYLTGFEDHIKLLTGELPGASVQDGVIEVVVSASEYNANFFKLGTVYPMSQGRQPEEGGEYLQFKVVGVYEPNYDDVNYWRKTDIDSGMRSVLLTSETAFQDYFFDSENARYLTSASWCYNVNLYGLKKDELGPYLTINENLESYFSTLYEGTWNFSVPINGTLLQYIDKSETLELTMWILNAPVLVMLLFYTYMVAKMIIEDDKNEISSLKCRGAYPKQIFYRYFLECGVISIFSLIAGPPLGLILSQLIGSANGFLEFVNRTGLDLRLLPESYLYALIASAVFMVMVLIPAYQATKTTIVQHKQKKARKNKRPVWEKAFLDIILLGLSIYLLYIYQMTDLITPDGSSDMTVYFISTVFIFACGMLFLRLYPYLLKLIYHFTKKRLPPTVYATFIQVSRNGNENRFLIMFLILTMAIGIYSSNTAGTINTNAEDIAKYKSGADIVVSPDWELDSVVTYTASDGSTVTGTLADMPAQYRTFSTDPFLEADGIEAMTRVSNITGAFARKALRTEWQRNVRLMAIEPYEFSQVSWIRPSLFNTDIHWYYYINLMQEYPTGILVSRELAELCDLNVGNSLEISFLNTRLDDQTLLPDVSCYVLGIFDYWPTFYEDYQYAEVTDCMVVMNLNYLLTVDDAAAYDVWFKKADGASSDEIYRQWEDAGLTENIAAITDRQTILNEEKSDSLIMALNGLFSLGFVATMIISFMGFLLYWLLSVRKRRLQFGVLRAMGLSKVKLSLMLLWEHLMTSGVSVVIGILIGYLTSYLYLPVLKKTFTTMLPLSLTYNNTDNIKVYVIVAIMILSGIAVLSEYINRLKINEAVKIGEE